MKSVPPRGRDCAETLRSKKDGSSPANSQVRKGGFHPSGAAPLGWKPPFRTCELPYDLLGFRTVSVARSANRMFEVDLVARPSHLAVLVAGGPPAVPVKRLSDPIFGH